MSVTLLLAAAVLTPAAPMAADAHAVPAAHEAVAGNATITAAARTRRSFGWLTTSGPDAAGQYRAWVNVADLDVASDAGFSAMSSRVQRATAMLCDISAEQPQVPGYFNRGERECLRNAQGQAANQMENARSDARQGRPVATLGLTR